MHTNFKQEIAVAPPGTTRVEIFVGEEAFTLLSEEWFLINWASLYQSCHWATVFQSKEFVVTWYKVYEKEYLPVIVRAETDGKLTGLLTMALIIPEADFVNKRVRIVGAGHFESEYQVWLAEETYSEEFIKAALTEIRKKFPLGDVLFRYLPPHVPLNWVKESIWKNNVVVESFSRPLMDMSDPDLPKLFRKTEFRNKLNRLKRLGDFSFDQITDINEFSEIIDELAVQFDFRQGAMFNKNRFRENPLKSKFLLEIFEQNLLHVTVLRVNSEILAAVVALVGKDWVYLGGINIHTPLGAHYYSPGFVHFLLLGQMLAKEGVAVFDLTPGGDSYKERMATRHDFVNELIFTNNFTFRFKRHIRKHLHAHLIKAGKRPMSVELGVEKKLYLLKAKLRVARKHGITQLLTERARKPRGVKIYKFEGSLLNQNSTISLHHNSLSDMLDYDNRGAGLTRWEFLEDAMRRFEAGEQAYTWVDNGRLMDCAWFCKPKGKLIYKSGEITLPEGAEVLQGFFHNTESRCSQDEFLKSVLSKLLCKDCQTSLFALVSGSDKEACHALEAVGFIVAA